MRNTAKVNRDQLLSLIESRGEDGISFTVHFLKRNNHHWFCFSQLQEEGSADVLAGHINLPPHIVSIENDQEITPGQKFTLQARVGSYKQKGSTRGTLKPLKGEKAIAFTAVL